MEAWKDWALFQRRRAIWVGRQAWYAHKGAAANQGELSVVLGLGPTVVSLLEFLFNFLKKNIR